MNQRLNALFLIPLATLMLSTISTVVPHGTEVAENFDRPKFLQTFLTHLNESQYAVDFGKEFLKFKLKGSSDKFVSIRFEPKTTEQKANWSAIVNLISRTFISLMDKAKVEHYFPEFIYQVPLSFIDPDRGSEATLSVAALKIAVG